MIASVSWRSSVLTNINDNKYTSGSPKYYPYIYFQAALRRKSYSLLRLGSWLSLMALPEDIVKVVAPTVLSPYL